MHENVKHGLDAAAAGTAFASLTGLLPSVASLLSIIWLVIQIIEWARKKRGGQ
jgi:sorbitol-specific phosphotransferase system component IIC